SIGNTIYFQVGDTIATISTDKLIYNLGDLISVNFENGPGIAKDWIGIFDQGADPNIDPLVNYVYFDGKATGSVNFESDNVPTKTGQYFVVMFTNDSYNEVSNRVNIQIISDVTSLVNSNERVDVSMYPNPAKSGQETVISYKYPIEAIDIYDSKGNMIYNKVNSKRENSVVMYHSLPAGTYYVHVSSEKLYRLKIVISE
ncbi:MAG: T9SS type A sorting domain-containing protein, partial [Cytophagales bacterium]